MILIVGATGALGGTIAQNLLAKDDNELRVLVRDSSAAERFKRAGLEPVTGDLRDKPSLVRACRGVDTVITTASAARRGGPDTIESVDIQGTCDLINAAGACGARRFVYVSAYGAWMNHASSILAAKAYVDAYLRNSSLAWTVLAPNLFMDTWVELVVGNPVRAGSDVVLPGEGRIAIPWLPRAMLRNRSMRSR